MAFFKFLFVSALLSVTALTMGTVGATGYVAAGGIATVRVQTPDVNLFIPVPLRVADWALSLAEFAPPEAQLELREVQDELDEFSPIVWGLIDELSEMPEGDLVHVRTANEEVKVTHRMGRFKVAVDAPDLMVRVSVPRRGAVRLTEKATELVVPEP